MIFCVGGTKIEKANRFKYLGCILNLHHIEKADIDRILTSFNENVGAPMSKFSGMKVSLKLFLFDTSCTSMYRLEMFKNFSSYIESSRKYRLRITLT